MKHKNEKGFTLILSLVLLLVMSLMGGGLVVVSSSDHQSNNSSDEFQQAFYIAENALLEAEKSLINKMMGPMLDTNPPSRNEDIRSIPTNVSDDISNLDQTRKLIYSIRSTLKDKNFPVMIDEEGGKVSRLSNFFDNLTFRELKYLRLFIFSNCC